MWLKAISGVLYWKHFTSLKTVHFRKICFFFRFDAREQEADDSEAEEDEVNGNEEDDSEYGEGILLVFCVLLVFCR